MDELDILKKDWNKLDKDRKQLSYTDIYPMLQKKSSSTVKTLFYISVAELGFWIFINLLPYFFSTEYRANLDLVYSNPYVFTALTVVSYVIILIFIYLLFKSHKAISVTDNAKQLMESILKTRKVIKYYVIYNLGMAFISMILGFYLGIHDNPELSANVAEASSSEKLIIACVIVVATALFVIIIWAFYKLIYGLLLKRLNQNYSELKKLEV